MDARARDLIHATLHADCTSCGLLQFEAESWTQGTDRRISLGNSCLELTHDEREAPYDRTDPDLLVSITDEGAVALCVWARPLPGSNIAGIGIDLASTADFAGERGNTYNRLLFSKREQAYVRKHYPEREELGYAFAFSAKEAAFKSLAAPLRLWYAQHTEELAFEVRCFELCDEHHSHGTLRHGEAQYAMERMGICAIELSHVELPEHDAVLTLAVARTGM